MALQDCNFRISVLVFLFMSKKVWNMLYTFWIGPAMCNVDIKSYGQWAMVTGSTDGIGKEYARQFAARGCDVILVSRSLDKLRNVASEIEIEFKVKTKIIEIDFTGDLSIYDKLAEEIQGLEIGTLVNNVGVSYPYLEYFLDLPDRSNLLTNLINVNIVSLIRVTSLVLPSMLKRNKGIIINLGSSSGNFPAPLLTVYAATKAFVAKFSECLLYEYGSKNLLVVHLSPSAVSTKMSQVDANVLMPTAEAYVKSSLAMVGCVTNSSGYFMHSVVNFFGLLLRSSSEFVTIFVFRKLALLIRANMLKKLGLLKTKMQ